MTSTTQALKIRISGPDGSTSDYAPATESIIVGSGAGAGLKVNDPGISNLHLLLKVERQGGVTAIDLGSEHGTWLGERQIRTPVSLSSGDVLRAGNTSLRVFFNSSEGRNGPAVSKRKPLLMQVVPAPSPGFVDRAPERISPLASRAKTMALISGPLPSEAQPTETSKVLQVALLWGNTVLDVRHFADGVPITVGEGSQNGFQVSSPKIGRSFTLAVPSGSRLRVNVPPNAGVLVSGRPGDSSVKPLAADGCSSLGDGAALEFGLRDCVQISLENLAFVLRFVRPSAAFHPAGLDRSNSGFLRIVGICALASAALILALLLMPRPEGPPSEAAAQPAAKYVKFLIQQEQKVRVAKQKQEGNGVPEGARAKDAEGRFGRAEAKRDQADPSKPGSPIVDERRREEDRRKVMTAGLLGALGDKSLASNIFGPGGLGSGINSALGGLKPGAGMGDARGAAGLGSRGTGTGGGGTGLGLGGLGTKGTGPGSGGYGSIDLAGRGKESTRVIPGKTVVVGGLSKDVIAKIIRQHQSEIKYCYEVELQKKPSLFGKVAVLFIIDASGSVSEANVSETSLDNQNTEQCMLSRIRRWKFPEPQGGGVVSVAFPWIFKPAGGEDS